MISRFSAASVGERGCLLVLRMSRMGQQRRMSHGLKGEAGAVAPGVPAGADLGLRVPSYYIWGAGTDVGKTLVSCGICNIASQKNKGGDGQVLYYKPVQTGFPQDSDADQVGAVCGDVQSEIGEHAAELLVDAVGSFPRMYGVDKPHGLVITRTEYAWMDPISPHLAVRQEGRPVSDEELIGAVSARMSKFYEEAEGKTGSLALIETAGAVLSPAPSGALQADVLRGFRIPGILVGDGKIGGISNTLCALESLLVRGYDVSCIVMMDMGLKNDEIIKELMSSGAFAMGTSSPRVVVLPPMPKRRSFTSDHAIKSWFTQCEFKFGKVVQVMHQDHAARVQRLAAAKEQARGVLWWPFTQHGSLSPSDVGVIDSRCGEDWSVYRKSDELKAGSSGSASAVGVLHRMFDASGSWWTMGMDKITQPIMSRAVAYACGRYGHVLFPQQVHEPALELAKALVAGPGKGWASRVFYSDNGSTAVEIAIKMAFRKYMRDHGLLSKTDEELSAIKFRILGLEGSYHGDTLGAMNAQSPSIFTGPRQFAWYDPMGVFLKPPTLALVGGEWKVDLPEGMSGGGTWTSRFEAFDVEARKGSPLAKVYSEQIAASITAAEVAGSRVGALVMEAVFHGAGGMLLLDPLYQHLLVQECRDRKIPVVIDEIFSGIWRFGRISACSIPRITPDVACYAKLLTGGTVPLAVTMSTESVYDSFLGDSKAEALLHGHSYTAHAIGCQAGVSALKMYTDATMNVNTKGTHEPMADQWDATQLAHLSRLPRVKRVVSIGTVCAVELRSESSGYASQGAISVIRALRDKGVAGRPLGNVVYFMASPLTKPETCKRLLESLAEILT